jgi:hypothetical protein
MGFGAPCLSGRRRTKPNSIRGGPSSGHQLQLDLCELNYVVCHRSFFLRMRETGQPATTISSQLARQPEGVHEQKFICIITDLKVFAIRLVIMSHHNSRPKSCAGSNLINSSYLRRDQRTITAGVGSEG